MFHNKTYFSFYLVFILTVLFCTVATGCTTTGEMLQSETSSEHLDRIESTTGNWHEVEDGSLYRLPDVSFSLNHHFVICPLYGDYFGDREGNDPKLLYPDEGLQALAADLARTYDVASVSGAMEYAYSLLPYLREMSVLQDGGFLGDGDVCLTTLFPTDDGVCLAHYSEDAYPEDYWALSGEERLKARADTLDGGFYVAFSVADGHVISLQNAHHGLIPASEPYGTRETKDYKEMISVYLKYEDISFEEQVLWGRGEAYRNIPRDSAARWDDPVLQKGVCERAEGLALYRAEDMEIFGRSLAELLPQMKGLFRKRPVELSQMTRYADGVWEFQYADPNSHEICNAVFVSEADGHIIHFINGNPFK